MGNSFADRRGVLPETLFELHEVVDLSKTFVARASPADVDLFTRKFHYSGHRGTVLWSFGLWHEASLLGVVSYNTPPLTACAALFGNEGASHVWHMGRLVCSDQAPQNSESRLIGGSLRIIRKEYPEVWAVLTYAATSQGHIGYVYQATNALYLGMTEKTRSYVDSKGLNRANRSGPAGGWVRVYAGSKHRYVYLLGNRRRRADLRARLRYQVLPYPKVAP